MCNFIYLFLFVFGWQYEMFVNKTMVLPTVKKLAILVGFANGFMCSMLSDVLRCFPCLETLDIKVQPFCSVNLPSNM